MVEISEMQIGTRAKVVDRWLPDGVCYEVSDMDRWLGKIVTVRRIHDTYVEIEESPSWAFNKNCFDYIIDDSEEIEPPDMGGILSLLGGGICG